MKEVITKIFGDSDNDDFDNFDETSWSDLSDLDETFIPTIKQSIKSYILNNRKPKKSKKNRKVYNSDEGLNDHLILPEGTQRKKRRVSSPSRNEINLGSLKKNVKSSKKMTDDEIDEICRLFVSKMDSAFKSDVQNNKDKKPGLAKLKMLDETRRMLLRVDFHEALIKSNVLISVRDWLTPLPDGTLPGINIRQTILTALFSFETITKYMLKQSLLGGAIFFFSKNDPDPETKIIANNLLLKYSRSLSSESDSWNSLGEFESHQKVERLSPSQVKILSEQLASGRRVQGSPTTKRVRGALYAARPIVSPMDYVNRPTSTVDPSNLTRPNSSKKFILSFK